MTKRTARIEKILFFSLHTKTTNQLGYYLAGLIEGDGSIILRKGENEKTSPKFGFSFAKNEEKKKYFFLPMYQRLQKILNTGVIYTEIKGVCRYSITNADAVIHLIHLGNGIVTHFFSLRTPKVLAPHR